MEQFVERISSIMEEVSSKPFLNIFGIELSTTVRNTWLIMVILFILVFVFTRKLSVVPTTRRQVAAEKIVTFVQNLVTGICGRVGMKFYGIIGGMFVTILAMNFLWVIPSMKSPTASYSTTLALAIVGYLYSQYVVIRHRGMGHFLRGYFHPLPFMFPFNLLNMVTHPLALSVRLFGNVFTDELLIAVMYIVFAFVLPLPFYAIAILSGVVQAYVFSILLLIYASDGLE